MEQNPVKKVSGHSGFCGEADYNRLDLIYKSLQETQLQGPVMDDLKYLYLKLQEALRHEELLRAKIDSIVAAAMKHQQKILDERINFRTHVFY